MNKLYTTYCKPFLKWAGGKSQLIPNLLKYVPLKYNKYIEPFVGGGAFYFHLNPNNSIISDSNEELIITYTQVRDNLDKVIAALREYKNEEEFYYYIRSLNPQKLSLPERAARLTYLNKTCFNGLYRVNKKGEFNVPYGKRKSSFLDEDILSKASDCLKSSIIIHDNYLSVLNKYASSGDFVFLDPPYYPISEYSDFKRYTKEFFYHEDHVILMNMFERLVKKGCYVVLTNSDHSVIRELFKDYSMESVSTKRLISCNPKTRSGKDLIISNINVCR